MKTITKQDKMYINALQNKIQSLLSTIHNIEKGLLSPSDYSHCIVTLVDEYNKFKDFTLPFKTSMSATERKIHNQFIKSGDKVVNHYKQVITELNIEIINENIVKITQGRRDHISYWELGED